GYQEPPLRRQHQVRDGVPQPDRHPENDQRRNPAGRSGDGPHGVACAVHRPPPLMQADTSDEIRANSGSKRSSEERGEAKGTPNPPRGRPGRTESTTTRAERYTASSTEWVTNRAANRWDTNNCNRSSFSRSRVISSSGPKGSSSRNSSGSKVSERASD